MTISFIGATGTGRLGRAFIGVTDSGQENQVTDSGQEIQVTDSGQENQITDSGQENQVTDSGQENQITDSGQENQVYQDVGNASGKNNANRQTTQMNP